MLRTRISRCILSIVALCLVLAVSSSAQAQTKRLAWSYQGGFFEDRGMDRWVEKNSSGTYYFKEVDRNQEFIELYDASRNCSVRLYADSMYLKGFNFPDFTRFYDGKWTR